jgi:hypothetical protein
MKAFSLKDFMDLRKPLSHLTFLIFSFSGTLIVTLTGIYPDLSSFSFSLFFLLFAQLEVFIYLGNILFAKLNFDRRPGEITRIVLIRFLIFMAGCLVLSMILFMLIRYAGLLIKSEDTSKVVFNFFHYGFRGWLKSTLAGLFVGALIFIVLLWQSSLLREQKLREENLIFQNETLKNQINPHFLFNSLNTLSSLIVNQPETAERFIGRLSSIYRYILENGRKDKITLQSELTFIIDYFELHKVREEKKIVLSVDAPDVANYMIMPVSLQILVENAIKHNMATRDNPLSISIYIEEDYIVVKNNLQKMAVQYKTTKIGLKNLAERSKLITGKDMIIGETKSDFIVKIPLLK